MRYPLWFPFPSCWLKALILEVSLIPLIIALRIAGESAFNALEVAWHNERWRFWVWIAISSCIVPIFVLGHIYQWLWGEPSKRLPQWIPSTRSWAEGLWMWGVIVVAIAIAFGSLLVWYELDFPRKLSNGNINFLAIAFLVVSAYLYHLRALGAKIISRCCLPKVRSKDG